MAEKVHKLSERELSKRLERDRDRALGPAAASLRGEVMAEVLQGFQLFARDASLGDVLIMRELLRDHDGRCRGEGKIILPQLFAEALGADRIESARVQSDAANSEAS